MKAYKGFNQNMTCRDFQYEEGKTYETDKAIICEAGFHACENPVMCFWHYSPNTSVFHEVELEDVSPEQQGDTKCVGKKITIGAKLGIPQICQLTFEYVKAHCTNEYNAEAGTPVSIDAPAPTITGNPKHNYATVKQFLMNPAYQSKGGSIDEPSFTLVARMDKTPPYLMTTKSGIGVIIYESDSPAMRKIKEFMAMYCIVDICMRMLNIAELKRIQGFPEDYILYGTQAEQKKYIGNAVEVNMACALCLALAEELNNNQ